MAREILILSNGIIQTRKRGTSIVDAKECEKKEDYTMKNENQF